MKRFWLVWGVGTVAATGPITVMPQLGWSQLATYFAAFVCCYAAQRIVGDLYDDAEQRKLDRKEIEHDEE